MLMMVATGCIRKEELRGFRRYHTHGHTNGQATKARKEALTQASGPHFRTGRRVVKGCPALEVPFLLACRAGPSVALGVWTLLQPSNDLSLDLLSLPLRLGDYPLARVKEIRSRRRCRRRCCRRRGLGTESVVGSG